MVRRLIVCRHGQDEDNAEGLLNGHRDRPLTDLGQRQAAEVAHLIHERHGAEIDAVLCSPLQRARSTAETIASRLGKEVRVHHDLIERDFGVLTGRPFADITTLATATLPTEKVLYFLEAEGAENFDVLRLRAERVVQTLTAEFGAEKTVLCVCHGDIGKMLLAVRRGVTWRDALLSPYIANTDVIVL